MTDKRNPTKYTEERSGRESSDGPPDLPSGAERAEYAGYTQAGEQAGKDKPAPAEDEAAREADLQPGRGKDAKEAKDEAESRP